MFTEKIYKSWKASQGKEYEEALKILKKNEIKLSKNKKILDIGIGSGFFESFLRNNGIENRIIGIDPNEEMLKQCNIENVEKILADGNKIPFPDGFFDIIFCFDTIHLIKKNDFIRVLKGNGYFLVSLFFNKQNLAEKEKELEAKLNGLQIIDKLILEGRENKLIYLAKKI